MLRLSHVLIASAAIFANVAIVAPVSAIVESPNIFSEPDYGISRTMALYLKRLVSEKQYDRALKEVEDLERQRPKDVAVANLKGALYLAKNDVANARRSFERALTLDPKSSIAIVELAQLDSMTGNRESARKRLTALLDANPRDTRAMIGMASLAEASHQDAQVVDWLRKAIEAAPTDQRAYVLLANHHLQNGEPQKAKSTARELLGRSPDSPAGLNALGAAELAAGETADAVKTFSRLVALAPQDAESRYKLATALMTRRDYDGARKELRAALSARPDFIDAKVLLATIEVSVGRPNEALRIARDIRSQHPAAEAGWQLEGDALMAQKSYPGAEQAYRKAYAMRKSAALATKLHAALDVQGRQREADAVVVDFLREQPGNTAARGYLAAAYAKAGRNKEALEQYNALIAVDANNVIALNNLAWLYQQEKDPRAVTTAEQALKLRPDNPNILDTAGWILVDQGDAKRGVELLRRAVELAPKVPVTRYHLAVGLVKLGDKDRARRELESVLDTNTEFAERAQAEQLLVQLRR